MKKTFANPLLLVSLAAILCLLPFIHKAFNIDDPLFIWSAKHILSDPFNFYGFKANWNGYEMEMSSINQNPPLVSYYIALIASLFSWEETTLHIAFFLPAIAFIAGTYELAKEFCRKAGLAALAALFTPVFLVSSTNVMSDTMMVAFYVWAIVLWIRGIKRASNFSLFAASILILLAALTKYFGMTLVVILLVFTIIKSPRMNWAVLYLLIPVTGLAVYQWYTNYLYGHGLIINAANYSMKYSMMKWNSLLTNSVTGLLFMGGGIASAFFFVPLLWKRKTWLIVACVGFATLSLIVLLSGRIGGLPLRTEQGIRWGLIFQFSLYFLAGLNILCLSVLDMWRYRNASSTLLFLWVFGTLCFATFFNWTTNCRTILPMVPAVAILMVRRLDDNEKDLGIARPHKNFLPLIPALCLTLIVTSADVKFANAQRTASQSIYGKVGRLAETVWFQGHWGFQYYMESVGAKPVDSRNPQERPGDLLLIPLHNSFFPRLPANRQLAMKYRFPTIDWLSTMQGPPVGAGFYASTFGPFPFVFGQIAPEEYWLFRIM